MYVIIIHSAEADFGPNSLKCLIKDILSEMNLILEFINVYI